MSRREPKILLAPSFNADNVALHHSSQFMILPELSHLQILVIEAIGAGQVSGRDLRARLAEMGARKSGPAFYQLMSRLEESRFVEGEYTQKVIDGQIFKERVYRVTGEGERAARETLEFYQGRRFGFA
jgi:DNA-binding PadR family transcriptional regulator